MNILSLIAKGEMFKTLKELWYDKMNGVKGLCGEGRWDAVWASVHLKNRPTKAKTHGPGRCEVMHTEDTQASLDGTQVLLAYRYLRQLVLFSIIKDRKKECVWGTNYRNPLLLSVSDTDQKKQCTHHKCSFNISASRVGFPLTPVLLPTLSHSIIVVSKLFPCV